MQLNLPLLDPPDHSSSSSPTAPSVVAWERLDEASRIEALEILARLIARMLAREAVKEASDE
jgi:hypothetical protein